MADIAIIFHWPLSELDALATDELAFWHQKAVDTWNKIHKASDE